MKHVTYIPAILVILSSCEKQEIERKIDKLALLAGDNPNGKKWRMTSFKTVSNYCTSDITKFETTESWHAYPMSIRDNVTIIYPDGRIIIDEGLVKYSDDSPEVYVDRIFWKLNTRQDSVAIADYVGLPSISGTWGLEVGKNNIVLTRKELNLVFKGSSLIHSVIFDVLSD